MRKKQGKTRISRTAACSIMSERYSREYRFRRCIIPLRVWPKPLKGFREVRIFLSSLSLIVSLILSVIFVGIFMRSNNLLLRAVQDQARSYFELIVQARLWNAQYNGVYVEKKEDVVTNQYQREMGIEPDISCSGGKILTARNPAAMTREISKLSGIRNGVRFHIASRKPINPDNAADTFELKALQEFEHGVKEAWIVDRNSDPPVYRYMAPLYTEKSCLTCHAQQGYRVGEIRGGISVSIPINELEQSMKTNKVMIIVLSVLTISLLLVIMYFLVWKLVVRLDESQEQLRRMSLTDELTGLRNRRYILERLGEEFQRARRLGRPMGLIMCDLDDFKKINDLHGHQFGDLVLKTVAMRMRSHIREYDLLGRIGGEEFLVICPDSDLEETTGIAERMRDIIKDDAVREGAKEARVSISAGMTMMKGEDSTIDDLFSRADTALYMAKEEGRDRVVVL